MVISQAIQTLTQKENIGYDMAKAAMKEIMDGQASDVQKSAYLTALSMKGETIEEITGSAEEMRAHSLAFPYSGECLEIVGTGGDRSNSFNISTTSSLVIAAANVPVAKHGNRAASSKSGAADCLEALGVKIDLSPEQGANLLKEHGICFLFAQKYHTSMKYVGPIRKELGIRTIFNILGPLTNPAHASLQVMGVYEEALLVPMAHVLHNLGVTRGLVVYGQERLDEISSCGPTSVCEFDGDAIKEYTIRPEDFGYTPAAKEELVGGTPEENAAITLSILKGEEKGSKRNAVCMNAGAALYVAKKAATIEEGVRLAEQLIDNGAALRKLEEFISESNK